MEKNLNVNADKLTCDWEDFISKSEGATNAHYLGEIQPIEYMQSKLPQTKLNPFEGYCAGNVIKYISRLGLKDDMLKDAYKALDYMLWLVMSLNNEEVDPMRHNHKAILERVVE